LRWSSPARRSHRRPAHGGSVLASLIVEAVYTFLLVYVVLNVAGLESARRQLVLRRCDRHGDHRRRLLRWRVVRWCIQPRGWPSARRSFMPRWATAHGHTYGSTSSDRSLAQRSRP
jgi:hypothetical protein